MANQHQIGEGSDSFELVVTVDAANDLSSLALTSGLSPSYILNYSHTSFPKE